MAKERNSASSQCIAKTNNLTKPHFTDRIAGVEISTDAEGRFNLNALHKASGGKDAKRPKTWLETKQAQEQVEELRQNSALGQEVLKVQKGGISPGTFAHELLAVEYAGWISPAFRLKVNQTFIDNRTGKLASQENPLSLPRLQLIEMAMQAEKERLALGGIVQEQARTLAQDWLAEVRKGGDPSAVKAAARQTPTINELYTKFMEDYSKFVISPAPRMAIRGSSIVTSSRYWGE